MGLYESLLRPLAFNIDPEKVHEIAMNAIAKGLVPGNEIPLEYDPVELFGVKFPNRMGLAAGFDKNALAVNNWHRFGFGYVEIGTVTWHPQPGNDQPRLFRLPEDKALINRMGFNNDGAKAVAERLGNAIPKIPIGVNLGKSKITPLEEAQNDYRQSFEVLQNHGDYFVVNVSSPNTPGLRSLQDREPLIRIFDALRTVNAKKPMFVKVAPDLTNEALEEILSVAIEMKLTGIIATNTTISREGLKTKNAKLKSQAGGLSGRPVFQLSNDALEFLAKNKPREMILMGVGGVFDRDDYDTKRRLGADLVQLYTGWIYGGPGLVPKILTG
ncbi:MAG: quinone-dependent dihydroorotate dehydrogenase [Armatimonadota bacterium]